MTANAVETAADPLMRSFERHLRAENKRQQTIDHYVGAARQFIALTRSENLPSIENINREHVEMWMERLHQAYKPPTVDQVQKDVVSHEDMARVLDGLTKAKKHRDALIVAILYDCGLRASEL